MVTTTRTFWGKWDCTTCGLKGLSGKLKQCSSCGNPREADELANVYIGATRNADGSVNAPSIGDAEELKMAHAGPDWSCPYCGSNERNDRGNCRNCGGSRFAEAESAAGDRGEGLADARARGSLTAIDDPGAGDGAELGASAPMSWAADRFGRARRWAVSTWRRRRRNRVLMTAGAFAVPVTALLVWGFWTYEVPGMVTGMRWTHTVHIETWTQVSDGAWAPVSERAERPPVNGSGEQAGIAITGCYMKHHHYEQYQCGTETEHYTEQVACGSHQECTTSSNSNGSFTESCSTVTDYCSESRTRTVPKYCDRSIEAEWCDYRTQKWIRGGSVANRGQGKEGLRWPSPALGRLQRGVRDPLYEVVVTFEDDGTDEHAEEMAHRGEYMSWSMGDPVIVTKRNFGWVVGIRRGGAE